MGSAEPDLGTAIHFLYRDAFSGGRVFPTSREFTKFAQALGDIFIRIYRLDPMGYAENERHVMEEFEKLARSMTDSFERFRDMQVAMQKLTKTVEDLEKQALFKDPYNIARNLDRMESNRYVIQEEPDVEELLS